MKEHEITKEDIDALLNYLPVFSVPGRSFGEWKGFDKEKGLLHLPFVDYDDDVEEFFMLASQECWTDSSYEPRKASRMLQDGDYVARASLDEVKTMLTFCVRGERFFAGHRLAALREGYMVALLNRLRIIRDELST